MEILELVFQDNLNPKRVAATNGGEYHSPCPACGGKDRFIIWSAKNRYYCRQCEKNGDVIQYLRDFHNLSFKDACSKANINFQSKININIKKSNKFIPIKRSLPSIHWQAKALEFVLVCHKNLLNNYTAINCLQKRGFSIDSIKKFQLGWNSVSVSEDWQLKELNRKIWMPKGIVISSFINNQISKIKIRRNDWYINDKFPKYVEIHGSSSGPTVFNLNFNLPVIILESELDAMLVQQEAENLCIPIALGGASKKSDDYIHNLLIQAPLILFSLDYDEAGIKAYKWWKKQYKKLIIWVAPFEKSVGDAFKQGLNIKEWISLGIKEYSKLTK